MNRPVTGHGPKQRAPGILFSTKRALDKDPFVMHRDDPLCHGLRDLRAKFFTLSMGNHWLIITRALMVFAETIMWQIISDLRVMMI